MKLHCDDTYDSKHGKLETLLTAHVGGSLIAPPRSWKPGQDHLKALVSDPWYRHLAMVSAAVHSATIRFMEFENLSSVPVPVTTTSVSSPMGLGSDSLPVRAEIAGHEVYLADSLQFLLELGLRISGCSQYYISNSFRGEEVDSTHLSEFSHSEVEIFGGLDSIMALAEKYVTHLAGSLLDGQSNAIMAVAGSLNHLRSVVERESPFTRIRFADAQAILADAPDAFENIGFGVRTITRKGEQHLMRKLGTPLWLTHLPAMASPFYQRSLGDGTYCASADLLLGPGEILGCGARCVDAAEVRASLARHDVAVDGYEWYVAMKNLAPIETAGFGLGLERFYMWAMQAEDIRDCTFWIRRNGEVVGP